MKVWIWWHRMAAPPYADLFLPHIPSSFLRRSSRRLPKFFFFSSRRRHTRSVSAFLLNRSSDLDCYQYFCVPEYGTANGRLHFHAVHFMRTLPTGSVDPNFGSEDGH